MGTQHEALVAMKAFFDGSGTRNSHFLVLAGVVADNSIWAQFEETWKSILDNRDPRAPIFT
jgi:hypothetical protein